MKKLENTFEKLVFASRWIQAPVYFGLIIASIMYSVKFMIELYEFFHKFPTMTEELVMLTILTLVDITMVLNLLVVVIIGGYATFVSKIDLMYHEDRPEWLAKMNAGTLKIKLTGSLVGVSGIHLLKTFVNIQDRNIEHVKWQVIIHVIFLLSTLALAYTEEITHKASSHSNNTNF